MSDNDMKVVDNCPRVVCGRSSVSNHKQHMKERNTKLAHLFDHTHIVLTEYVTEEKDTEGEKKQKKRTTCDVHKPVVYVYIAPKDFKLSGVKKLLLLLLSPSCERHGNISRLLELLGIDAIEFGFSCDIKMLLILLGKQGAGCTHCCPRGKCVQNC